MSGSAGFGMRRSRSSRVASVSASSASMHGDPLAGGGRARSQARDLGAVRGRPALDGLADLLRGRVPLGLERLALAEEATPVGVELRARGRRAPGSSPLSDRAAADDVGLVAEPLQADAHERVLPSSSIRTLPAALSRTPGRDWRAASRREARSCGRGTRGRSHRRRGAAAVRRCSPARRSATARRRPPLGRFASPTSREHGKERAAAVGSRSAGLGRQAVVPDGDRGRLGGVVSRASLGRPRPARRGCSARARSAGSPSPPRRAPRHRRPGSGPAARGARRPAGRRPPRPRRRRCGSSRAVAEGRLVPGRQLALDLAAGRRRGELVELVEQARDLRPCRRDRTRWRGWVSGAGTGTGAARAG